MLREGVLGAVLSLTLIAGSAYAVAQDGAPLVSHLDADLTQGVSLDDLRAVVSEAGGVVEIVKEKDDNAFEIETNFPGDWSPWIDALHCTGDGDARRCSEYEIGVEVRAPSAARARALSRKLQFKYLSTTVDGPNLVFTRLDTTAGGVTRAHIAQELRDIVTIMRNEVAPVVWEQKELCEWR